MYAERQIPQPHGHLDSIALSGTRHGSSDQYPQVISGVWLANMNSGARTPAVPEAGAWEVSPFKDCTTGLTHLQPNS